MDEDSLLKESVFLFNHAHWKGIITFSENGFFSKDGVDFGKASLFSSGRMILKWHNWPEEDCLLTKDEQIIGSNFLAQKINGAQIRSLLPLIKEEGLKVHFGCWHYQIDGWLNVDLPNFDLRDRLPFLDDSVSLIYLEHVIEHLTPSQIYLFLNEAKRVLKKGGVIRLAFPDIERIACSSETHPDELSRRKIIENNILLYGHKSMLSAKIMLYLLRNLGFEAQIRSRNTSFSAEMGDIVQHEKEVGRLLNKIETSYVEGMKMENSLDF